MCDKLIRYAFIIFMRQVVMFFYISKTYHLPDKGSGARPRRYIGKCDWEEKKMMKFWTHYEVIYLRKFKHFSSWKSPVCV